MTTARILTGWKGTGTYADVATGITLSWREVAPIGVGRSEGMGAPSAATTTAISPWGTTVTGALFTRYCHRK